MEINFSDPKYYTNRELSWVLFDHRVLNEARDKNIPLFERLKFLSITASNLDEFFMIRVASLKDMENAGYTKKDIAGMTPTEQLKALHVAIHELVDLQYSTYNRSLLPLLEKNGLHIIREHEQLTAEEAVYVDQYFQENVYPVLTPMAVDFSADPQQVSEHRSHGAEEKQRRGTGIRHRTGTQRLKPCSADPVQGQELQDHSVRRDHRTEHG